MAPRKKAAPSLDNKPGRYFLAKRAGNNKKAAAIVAGYADGQHTALIEKSKTYQEIERHYKNVLGGHISMDEIAEAHADNIRQDKDRGARNKAIEIALERIEPSGTPPDEVERVLVILR